MKRRDEIVEAAQAAASAGVETADVITLAMPVLVADFKDAWHAEDKRQDGEGDLAIPGARTEEGLRQALQTLSMILEPTGVTLL